MVGADDANGLTARICSAVERMASAVEELARNAGPAPSQLEDWRCPTGWQTFPSVDRSEYVDRACDKASASVLRSMIAELEEAEPGDAERIERLRSALAEREASA